jgi:hypothetical protein
MKPQFQHEVTTSFMLWADNFLLRKGEAYTNYTSTLYPNTSDDRLSAGLISYSSPHKQWVFDSSIEGANIPNGIDDNGNFIPRDTNGLKLDFDNGRAILDSSFGNSKNGIKATYSVKDFNFYITNQSEEQLIIDSKFDINDRFKQDLGGIAPYKQVIPAIFVNSETSENQPYAFGGEDKTSTNIRCVVFAENTYQLDGALSIFNDSKNEVYIKLSFEDYPMNEYGDVIDFNYKQLSSNSKQQYFHIEGVTVSKLSDRINKNIDPALFVGFIDFQITNLRFPRS